MQSPLVLGRPQDAQVSLHASWQQTWSVQKPLPHSASAVQVAPKPFEVPGLWVSVMVTETAPVRQRDGARLAGAIDQTRVAERVELEAQHGRGGRPALGRYWNVSWPVEIWGTTLNCRACSSSPVTMRRSDGDHPEVGAGERLGVHGDVDAAVRGGRR